MLDLYTRVLIRSWGWPRVCRETPQVAGFVWRGWGEFRHKLLVRPPMVSENATNGFLPHKLCAVTPFVALCAGGAETATSCVRLSVGEREICHKLWFVPGRMHETPRAEFYPTSCVLELRLWRFAQVVQKAPQVVATPSVQAQNPPQVVSRN
jgi:hypothetical protein